MENTTVITNYGNFITKFHSYYKMHFLQIATVQYDNKWLPVVSENGIRRDGGKFSR